MSKVDEGKGAIILGRMKQLLQRTLFRGGLIGLLAATVSVAFAQHPFIQALESWALDTCFILRGVRTSPCPVTIVGIDETTLDQLRKPHPFISPELAEVIRYLSDAGVAVIGVDVFIPEELSAQSFLQEGAEGDAETFGRAVIETDRVILPIWELNRTVQRPVPQWTMKSLLAPADTDFGFVNLTPDPDYSIRRQQLLARFTDEDGEDVVYGNLAYAMWRRSRHEGLDIPLPTSAVDTKGMLRINYVGPPGTTQAVSLSELLESARRGDDPGDQWTGRMVILGATALSLADLHPTPYFNQSVLAELGTLFGARRGERMSGPEIHANVLATLADGAFLLQPPQWANILIVVFTGVALGAFFARSSLEKCLLLVVVHHFAWRAATFSLFNWEGILLPIVPVLVTGGLTFTSSFALRWHWMRQTMGMFKSEAVARVVEADPQQLTLKGENRHVTILFSDVRNFTTYSEEHTPQEIVRLLNSYFSKVVPVVEKHGGIVNQYIGDGLMVIFGAPNRQPDHAYRAVRVAIEMVRKVHEAAGLWKQLNAPNFRIGIGVCTGEVVVGTIGSPRRLDYTAIGDTVNTAARIESATKELGVEILLSSTTIAELTPQQRAELGVEFQSAQALKVKGKFAAIEVIAVVLDNVTSEMRTRHGLDSAAKTPAESIPD